MEYLIPAIKNCILFEQIEDADLPGMFSCLGARMMTAEKNQTIFQEGDPARFVGVVLSGAVQILRDDYDGNRSILASLSPGQLFAEVFACAEAEAMPVSVVAIERSRVMLLDCGRILTTCGNACQFHARIIQNLLRAVAAKNLVLNQKIEILSKRTTKEKLMTYLLAEARRQGNSQFTIPYDRQGLADYLGVERSAMSAELGKLRREGKIQYEKNWFHIIRQE